MALFSAKDSIWCSNDVRREIVERPHLEQVDFDMDDPLDSPTFLTWLLLPFSYHASYRDRRVRRELLDIFMGQSVFVRVCFCGRYYLNAAGSILAQELDEVKVF